MLTNESADLVRGGSARADDVHLAFCVDRFALTGLHISLASALQHLSSGRRAVVHLVHHGLEDPAVKSVLRTVRRSGRRVELFPVELVQIGQFEQLRGFVGGQMCYARLVLPNLIKVPKVIYLDADLLVGTDLSELYDVDLAGHALGAVSWEDRARAHDRRLYEALALDMAVPYFNSGVLVMDLDRWRRERLTEKLLARGRELRDQLISHDQSLINVCLASDTLQLPRKFNTPVSPRRRTLPADALRDRVVHLVARPKPWDPIGWLNGQYVYYRRYLPFTDLEAADPGRLRGFAALHKVLRSFRAYAKCLVRQ